MAEKKKKNTEEVIDSKKLAALEARLEGLNEELEEAKNATEEAAKKTEEAEKKAESAKGDYLRLMAEFDTFRRRTAEEKLALVSSASADTIKGLLPILDDCEIALASLEKSTDSDAAKEGTQMIFTKLTTYLKGKGLERIEAKGSDFDTELHEAVTTFPAPSEELKGKVIDVVQTGYTLGGKVLRYAKVVVGA
jgi:molecular chaperone GrpE